MICTPYVPTGEQFADILTKGVQNASFKGILDKLGNEESLPSSLRGSVEDSEVIKADLKLICRELL